MVKNKIFLVLSIFLILIVSLILYNENNKFEFDITKHSLALREKTTIYEWFNSTEGGAFNPMDKKEVDKFLLEKNMSQCEEINGKMFSVFYGQDHLIILNNSYEVVCQY